MKGTIGGNMEEVGAVIDDCCHVRPKQTLDKHGDRERLPAHEIHMCIALTLILVDLTSLINTSYCQLGAVVWLPQSHCAFSCSHPLDHDTVPVFCFSSPTVSDLRPHAPLLSTRLPLYSVSSPHSWLDGDPILISQFYDSLLLQYTAPRVRLGQHSSLR